MSLHTQQNATLNNHRNNVHTSDGIEVPSHYKWGNGLYSYAHPVFQESSHLSDSLKKKKEKRKRKRFHTFPMSPNMITRCKEF